jgi:hypothetical protein
MVAIATLLQEEAMEQLKAAGSKDSIPLPHRVVVLSPCHTASRSLKDSSQSDFSPQALLKYFAL